MNFEKLTPMRILAFLYIGYFASRLYALTLLPIFVDEGMHIHWALGIWQGELWDPLFYSRLLQVWLMALVVPWVPDPLWASRFITVLSGAVTVWACFEIGRRLYNEKVGLLSAGLYIISPFALFYDRMALADGILSMFAALTLLWTIALIQEPKRKYVWLLGLSMVLGIMTKIPGLLLLLTPFLAGILLSKARGCRLWLYLGGAYLITLGLVAVPIGVWFSSTGVFADKSILVHRSVDLIRQFIINGLAAFEWLWGYWTPPILILGIVGYPMALINRRRESFLLALLTSLPIFGFALISGSDSQDISCLLRCPYSCWQAGPCPS
jgi:4-amino-4-deoxy-L-arabinose transferase-like glycosyltransferase